MLDQASIKFTRNLYQNLLSGMQVCAAFNSAVDQTKVVLGRDLEHESEKNKLFMLLKHDEYDKNNEHAKHDQHPSRKQRHSSHECCSVFDDDCPVDENAEEGGGYVCLSDHILLKFLPDLEARDPEYRL